MQSESLKTRTFWVLVYQLTFASVMAVSAYALQQLDVALRIDHLAPILWTVAGWCFLSWGLSKTKWLKDSEGVAVALLAWAQVFFGVGLTATLVQMTGGIDSSFTLLFALQICLSAILLQARGSAVGSLLCALSYVLVCAATIDSWNPAYLPRIVLNASLLLFVGGGLAYIFQNRERIRSALRRTESELAQSRQFQQTLLDHIPSGVLYISSDGWVKWQNIAATRILARSYEGERLTETDLSHLLEYANRAESSFHLRHLGSERILGHHLTELPQGERVIVFQDVTEIRLLEEKMKLQGKLAAIGEFAAALAHEIKNPLASMSGSIQLLRSELNQLSVSDAKNADRLMSIVIRETDRLDHLLQNFLNYAKPSQVQRKEVLLKPLVGEIIELLKARTQNSSELQWMLLLSEKFSIRADALMLRQIFWNLLKNAQESNATRVEISANEQEQAVLISDNGGGIPHVVLNRIFDPFFTTKETGSGLGLALVYQMMSAHGGEICVQSEEGKGTRFELRFPGEDRWEAAA